jgi:predicted peptidase
MRSLLVPALLTGLIAARLMASAAPAPQPTQNPKKPATKVGFHHFTDYTVFVPHAYKGPKDTKTYPLILYLHGYGQANTPPEAVKGLGTHISHTEAKFPFFVIFPRGAHDGFWYKNSKPLDSKRALEILQTVQTHYKVIDAQRLYLTGVSMGGLGVWDLAEEKPGLWAAIVPVSAGQGNDKSENDAPQKHAATIKDIPCWCFHGLRDTTVDPHWTKDMVKALQNAGGHPKHTYPPHADHEQCWPIAYGTAELYDWLLKQHRQ